MALNIEVMDDLEHIRARYTMYTDSVDHATKEAIDNVIDEYQASYCTYLGIALDTKLNQIIVVDNGRGVPIDVHDGTISKFAIAFTKLHSSGKYSNREINSYNNTIGLNGVGIKVTSATSKIFEAWTKKKKTYKVTVVEGVLQQVPDMSGISLEDFPPLPFKEKKLTTVLRYTPDSKVFGANYCKISPTYLTDLCSSLQYLCPKLAIELIIDNETTHFFSTKGIVGLLHSDLFDVRFSISNSSIDIVLWWDLEGEGETILSFVNCQKTKDGGSHVVALKSSILEAFDDTSLGAFLREGLRCVMHVKVAEPLFQGQNKHRLLNPEAASIVAKAVTRDLSLFLANNLKLKESISQRAASLKKAHETFKKDKEAIKSITKSKLKYTSLPDKLVTAPNCQPQKRELIICEGASAAGPIVKARTRPLYQEVYMLKGKITNVCRYDVAKVLANPDIMGLVHSIGCGVLDACSLKNMRVGKILLLPDADSDGFHIAALLTAFFVKYMAPVVEAGMLYMIKSPLYVATYKEYHWYGNGISDQAALLNVKSKIPDNLRNKIGKPNGVTITRFKGHGAASSDAIRDYALNCTREVQQITLSLGETDIIHKLMGDDVTARKELLDIV